MLEQKAVQEKDGGVKLKTSVIGCVGEERRERTGQGSVQPPEAKGAEDLRWRTLPN